MDLFGVGGEGGGFRTAPENWCPALGNMGPGCLLQLQGGQMTVAQACTTASCGKFWRKKKKKIPVFEENS